MNDPYAPGPIRTPFHDSTIADTLDWAEREARKGRAGQGTTPARLPGPIDPLLADLLGAAAELRRAVGAVLAVPLTEVCRSRLHERMVALSTAKQRYDAAARAWEGIDV